MVEGPLRQRFALPPPRDKLGEDQGFGVRSVIRPSTGTGGSSTGTGGNTVIVGTGGSSDTGGTGAGTGGQGGDPTGQAGTTGTGTGGSAGRAIEKGRWREAARHFVVEAGGRGVTAEADIETA